VTEEQAVFRDDDHLTGRAVGYLSIATPQTWKLEECPHVVAGVFSIKNQVMSSCGKTGSRR
jgi:hypothetical protein